jgi:membrane AbrB-like protein
MPASGRRAALRPLALALVIGSAGGALAAWANLPLAWMIGAMLATTAASAGGLSIAMPVGLRSGFVVVLGIMLGSSFSPEILERLGDWALSLSMLLVYTAAGGGAGYLYFRRLVGYDRITAYFAAMPGGLTEMVLVGGAMGGDARTISMTHGARILLVVLALPFAFQLVLGYDPATKPAAGPTLAAAPVQDLVILAFCGIAGFLAARAMRLPAAPIVGPMVASAAVHLAGWTSAQPPVELVAVAQIVVGSAIGCRFAGVAFATIARAVLAAAGGTVVLVAVTLLIATALHAATGLPASALILAFSPGGLAEMSLIAIALSMDAAFVATHHIVRIFLIVVLAPLVFRLLGRRAVPSGE